MLCKGSKKLRSNSRRVDSFCKFAKVISKNKIKLIHSLETKKGREKVGLFVAEGPKVVNDLLHEGFVADEILEDIEDIKKVSFLQHPQPVLGIFRMPEEDCKVQLIT